MAAAGAARPFPRPHSEGPGMRYVSRRLALTAAALSLAPPRPVQAQRDPPPLYRSGSYELTPSAIRQGRFEAHARGRDSIVSTYPRSGREVRFRFSLNGADNEFRPGTE